MSAMKVTISAAMRARDVSRAHAEHLAWAEEAEAGAVRARPATVADAAAPVDAGIPADAAAPADAAVRVDPGSSADAVISAGRAGPGGEVPGEVRDGGRERQRPQGRPGRPGGARRWRPRGTGRGR